MTALQIKSCRPKLENHRRPQEHQFSVQDFGNTPACISQRSATENNSMTECLELRLFISEKLSLRCQCFLNMEIWISPTDNAQIQNLARQAMLHIISLRIQGDKELT